MKTSQKTKILNLLDDNRWHCSSEFYAMYIADPRTIMAKLKSAGKVQSRWCKRHPHDGSQKEWALTNHSPVVPQVVYRPLPRDSYENSFEIT